MNSSELYRPGMTILPAGLLEKIMLNIYFGDMDKAYYGPSWFKFNYDPSWFEDPFVQEMMEDIDHSAYKGGSLIESEVLGPIPPERLSGGLMTLISIYENPELIFDATSCGENCAEWLLKIGEKSDVTVELNYLMPFKGTDTFKIRIVNTGKIVTTEKDYVFEAADLLP